MAGGYDISASNSFDFSSRAATGAIKFGKVRLLGTGNNNFVLLAVAVAVAFLYFRNRK